MLIPRFFLISLFILSLGISTSYAQTAPSVPQNLSTPNGHTFWYVHTPNSPVTALHALYPFSYRALTHHSPALHRIIANLTEKLLTTRTLSFNSFTTSQILNNYAASITIDITSLHVAVRMNFVTSTKNALQPLFHATLNENFIDTYNLKRYKIAEKIYLSEKLKEPNVRLWRAFARTMFQDSPWGSQGLATPDQINIPTPRSIIAFNTSWQQSSARFIALTSMSKDETSLFIDSILPRNTPASPLLPPPAPPSPKAWGQHIHLQDTDLRQTKIMLVLPGLPREHPSSTALRILARILQEHYLTPSIREERGLAYGVNAYTLFYPSSGFVFIQSATDASQTLEVISLIKKAIQNILEKPITEDTLEAARKAAINSLTLGLTDNNTIADTFIQPLRDNEPPDIFSSYTQKLNAVTPEDLHRLAQDLWTTSPLLLTIGPSSPPPTP